MKKSIENYVHLFSLSLLQPLHVRLCPWMMSEIHLLDPVHRYLGIDLGSGYIRVAKHLLEGPEISAPFKEMRGKTVPHRVGRKLNAEQFPVSLYGLPEALPCHGCSPPGHEEVF